MYIDWRKPLLFLTFEHAKGSTRTSKALSASWEGISPARPRTAWQDNVTLWKLWNVRYEKNLKIKKKKLCPFAVKNIQMVSVRLFPNWGNFVQGELQEFVLHSACWSHSNWPAFGLASLLSSPRQLKSMPNAFSCFLSLTQDSENVHSLSWAPACSGTWQASNPYESRFLPHRPWHQIPCLKGKRRQHRAALGTRGLRCAMQWPKSADSTSHSARHQDTSQISKTLRCTGLVPWPSILASGPTSTIVRDASDEGSYWGRNSSIRQKQGRHVLGIKEVTARPRFTFVLLKNLIWVRVLPSKTGCVPRAACSPVRSEIPKLQMQTAE